MTCHKLGNVPYLPCMLLTYNYDLLCMLIYYDLVSENFQCNLEFKSLVCNKKQIRNMDILRYIYIYIHTYVER